MSKGSYKPLTKEIMIQGLKFKIRALTFEDVKILSAINPSNALEFAKTLLGTVLESEGDLSTLPLPIYTELVKEIMEFSGLRQNNNMFNPSLRQQSP